MRRTVTMLVVAAGMVWALPASPSAAHGDSARGAGTYTAGAEEYAFGFKASSGPLGENPKGTMKLERTDGLFSARAEVFCMSVSGNLATLVGTITKAKGFVDFEELVFKVQDNALTSTPDRFVHSVQQQGAGQAECFNETPAFPIDSGDIEVVDNVPPPASQDSAIGQGTFTSSGTWTFDFNATSGPLGENPSGTMAFERDDGAFSAQADVFCLSVVGNLATMVGTITQTQGFEAYEELVFKVQDNAAVSQPDRFVFIVTEEGTGQAECFPETPAVPIDSGDIVVTDGLP